MPQIDSVPSSTSRSVTIEKQYQALIVLIPVSIAAIILLLFYVFYLRRGGGLRARRASTENNNDMSNPLEFGLRKDIAAMLPAAALKDSFNSRDPQCSVCLGNYQEDDKLQEIPECGHIFHVDCIGRWLTTHTTCPLCRLSLLSSMETPELRLEPIDDVDHHHLETSQQ